MDVLDLSEILQNNLDKVLSPVGYKHLLNRANNLIRFDVVNRMLIEAQSDSAYDLRTEQEWNIDNRKLNSNAKPVFIIVPKYKYGYMDTDTNKIVDNMDLSPDEILKAIEYDIIERVETIDDAYTLPLFDIKQTSSMNNAEYKVYKPVVSTEKLFEITKSILCADIEVCDQDYYSAKHNTIYISRKPYKDLVYTISEYITQYFIDDKLNELLCDSYETSIDSIDEETKKLIKDSLHYSICTLLRGNCDITFDYITRIQYENKILVLNIVDNFVNIVIEHMEFTSPVFNGDAIINITRLCKAEKLLNIMEASYINKKLKGQ